MRSKKLPDVFAPSYNLSFFVFPGDWRALNERYEPYERPILMHELGIIGNYVDLDTELRYEGTRIGTDYYAAVRRYLKEKVSCRWRADTSRTPAPGRPPCTSTTRNRAQVQLYQGLQLPRRREPAATTAAGYPCGIMNEFYELKPGRQSKAPQVQRRERILLDLARRRNLTVGQKCSYAAMSSLYGSGPLADGTLHWYLAGSESRVYERGSFAVNNVPNGSIETLGNIEFAAPEVDKPIKLTLHVRLSGGEYEIVNDWDLWVFPKRTAPDISADIRVVSELDPDTLAFLNFRHACLNPVRAQVSSAQQVCEIDSQSRNRRLERS